MNPFILLAISLPLLLGGCEEKPVAETKPVEEKQQEVKEEVKTEEPVAETKPELEGVDDKELEERESIWYLKDSEIPYTGKIYSLHPNGQKKAEGNAKDGKFHGLQLFWHENGQKKLEGNTKDGKFHGLVVGWSENGQRRYEAIWNDGLVVSEKRWKNGKQGITSMLRYDIGKIWDITISGECESIDKNSDKNQKITPFHIGVFVFIVCCFVQLYMALRGSGGSSDCGGSSDVGCGGCGGGCGGGE